MLIASYFRTLLPTCLEEQESQQVFLHRARRQRWPSHPPLSLLPSLRLSLSLPLIRFPETKGMLRLPSSPFIPFMVEMAFSPLPLTAAQCYHVPRDGTEPHHAISYGTREWRQQHPGRLEMIAQRARQHQVANSTFLQHLCVQFATRMQNIHRHLGERPARRRPRSRHASPPFPLRRHGCRLSSSSIHASISASRSIAHTRHNRTIENEL